MSDSLQPHGIAACQASLSISNSWNLLKLRSIESVMPSNHLILCRPLLLPPSIFPSFRVFSNESALRIRWPNYWSFSFSISPSSEHPGLISFRIDWSDLLAVQGTLKILLQHHSRKHQFFGAQLLSLASFTVMGKQCVCVCVCVKCILDVQLVQLNVPKKGWGSGASVFRRRWYLKPWG